MEGTTMSVKFLANGGATLQEWAGYLACFAPSVGPGR